MPEQQKTGTTYPARNSDGSVRHWPSGRVRYRGKVTWPDGKRQDFGVPEQHCKDETSAVEHVKHVQEQLTKGGSAVLAKLAATKPRTKTDDGQVWFDGWLAERKKRGLTSWRENVSHYRDHIRPVISKHVRDWTVDDSA